MWLELYMPMNKANQHKYGQIWCGYIVQSNVACEWLGNTSVGLS